MMDKSEMFIISMTMGAFTYVFLKAVDALRDAYHEYKESRKQ